MPSQRAITPTNRTAGCLTVVGMSVTAVSQMSAETLGHIRNADVVFYNAKKASRRPRSAR
jgi:hypothetical protein